MAEITEEFTIKCCCGGSLHWKGRDIDAIRVRNKFFEIHAICLQQKRTEAVGVQTSEGGRDDKSE